MSLQLDWVALARGWGQPGIEHLERSDFCYHFVYDFEELNVLKAEDLQIG
jgi:hypothetical protein